jgi:hypothetical protein
MDLARITRAAIAAVLITAWAGAMMFSQIDLATLNLLLYACAFVQQDMPFFHQRLSFDRTILVTLLGVLVLAAILHLMTTALGEETMNWFARSPYLVLPAWLIILRAITRRGVEPASAPVYGLSRPAITETPAKPAARPFRLD